MRLRFDRGTVVADDPPAELDVSQVSGFVWDPRVAAWRAPAFRHRDICAALSGKNVRFSDDVRPAGQVPGSFGALEMRPYQDAAIHAWEIADRRGIVALPTGSGKTRIAMGAMARACCPTICLVPTRVLLAQWLNVLQNAYPGTIGCFGDGARELAPITVATFESAYRHMAEIGNRFDLVVVDEAHHFGGGVKDEALEMSIARARLGLSATPPRDAEVARRLTERIGPVVFELALGDLAGQYLAPFDVVTLKLDLTPDERAHYEGLMRMFRDVHGHFSQIAPGGTWADFARFASRTESGRAALSAWRAARSLLAFPDAKRRTLANLLGRHRDARVLVFTAENATAYTVARERLIMPITCDIDRKERAEALARFARGELRALVSSRVLNEGLDVPDADVAIVLGGTRGEREHVQRIGRLLRPAHGKRALVYDLAMRQTTEVYQARKRQDALAARV